MKKILIVGGARPNFVKIAPIIHQLEKSKILNYILVHTGQHYDYDMSEAFFEDLQIPKPDYFLKVGSGSHAEQTAKVMIESEKVLSKENPDCVIVVGDVNSTVAVALATKKQHIKLAHIEAGLRSNDRDMPEEINRLVTDSITDCFFVTEKDGLENLKKENKLNESVFFVGNVMIDSLHYYLKQLEKVDTTKYPSNKLIEKFQKYILLTLHRPSNVDNEKQLIRILSVLEVIAKKTPIVMSLHPRTKKRLEEFSITLPKEIYFGEKPYAGLEFMNLMNNSIAVITDSGGIQEETTALGKPCFTIRNNTERPITVTSGTNTLITDDLLETLPDLIDRLLEGDSKAGEIPPRWDGKAAERIVEILENEL